MAAIQLHGTYRNGVLYLDEPLPMPDGTPVAVTVTAVQQGSSEGAEIEEIDGLPTVSGVVKPRSRPEPSDVPLSAVRAAELAEIFSRGGPLSDLVIQDRDEH
jgi:hypothetical protein